MPTDPPLQVYGYICLRHQHITACVCVYVCVRRLTWRLVLEPDTPHTIHTDMSLIHLFNFSFLSLHLFYFFWFPTSTHGICYMRHQWLKLTLLKYSCLWHRKQLNKCDDDMIKLMVTLSYLYNTHTTVFISRANKSMINSNNRSSTQCYGTIWKKKQIQEIFKY